MPYLVEFGRVAFRVQFIKNVVVGMYDTISVVKLIVNIQCDNGTLHSLYILRL